MRRSTLVFILFALIFLGIVATIGNAFDVERCHTHGGEHLGLFCYDKDGNVVDD